MSSRIDNERVVQVAATRRLDAADRDLCGMQAAADEQLAQDRPELAGLDKQRIEGDRVLAAQILTRAYGTANVPAGDALDLLTNDPRAIAHVFGPVKSSPFLGRALS